MLEKLLLVFLLVVAMALVASVPVYFLWNWLMPTIFGLPELTLFQSLGVVFLSSLLFKSSQAKVSDK